MEPFLEIFGDLTISFAVKVFCAIVFVVAGILKGKKIKVYYKQSNPKITLSNNNTPLIVGSFFIIIGICIFFIFI